MIHFKFSKSVKETQRPRLIPIFLEEGTGSIWNLEKYLRMSMIPDTNQRNLSMGHISLILKFQIMILVRTNNNNFDK